MSSARLLIVTGSAPLLVTDGEKVKVPPGAGRMGGWALWTTETLGRTSVRVTMASSVSVTTVPAGLVACTVTTSVWLSPALPVKGAVN